MAKRNSKACIQAADAGLYGIHEPSRLLNAASSRSQADQDFLSGASPSSRSLTQTSPRSLPQKDVAPTNIEESYCEFVLYCNPLVPLNTDTSELRRAFSAPPRSDGQTFSTFRLFELVRELNKKDWLKTWGQLALELGVQAGDISIGQSPQKIQQYCVRLKRWMRTMHVDAFFDYLLGTSHPYFLQIPTAADALEMSRDGVSPEEDLALRALLPELRPKRGRRKAEAKAEEEDSHDSHVEQLDGQVIESPVSVRESSRIKSHTPISAGAAPGISSGSNPVADYFETNKPAHIFPWVQTGQDSRLPAPTYDSSNSAVVPTSTSGDHGNASPDSGSAKRRRRNNPLDSTSLNTSGAGPRSPRSFVDIASTGGNSSAQQRAGAKKSAATVAMLPEVAGRGTTKQAQKHYNNFAASHSSVELQPGTSASWRARNNAQIPSPDPATPNIYDKPDFPFPQASHHDASAPLQNQGEKHRLPIATASSSSEKTQDGVRHEAVAGQESGAVSQPTSTMTGTLQEDRTNVEKMELACAHLLLSADWSSMTSDKTEACSIQEALVISKQIIIDMSDEAPTKELFLMTLCSLFGAPALLSKPLEIRRVGEDDDGASFAIRWAMKFGGIEGSYVKTVTVAHKAFEGMRRQFLDESDVRSKEVRDIAGEVAAKDASLRKVRADVLKALIEAERRPLND